MVVDNQEFMPDALTSRLCEVGDEVPTSVKGKLYRLLERGVTGPYVCSQGIYCPLSLSQPPFLKKEPSLCIDTHAF